jgi:hypothetical protein
MKKHSKMCARGNIVQRVLPAESTVWGRQKNARTGVPVHAGGVCVFFDFVGKNTNPTLIGLAQFLHALQKL